MVSRGSGRPTEHARARPGAQPLRHPRRGRDPRAAGPPSARPGVRCRTIVAMSLRPLGRALRRIAGAFPVTVRGIGVAALCVASLRVWGYGSLDLVVFALAVTGLALLAISAAVVAAAALFLRGKRRTLPASWPARLEADRPLRTGLSLPALERLPLVAVDWSVAEPVGVACRVRREAGRAHEELTPSRRGIAAQVRRRFRVGDVFGLVRIAWERDEAASFAVLPATRGLRRLVWLRALASGEGIPHPAGRPEGDRM